MYDLFRLIAASDRTVLVIVRTDSSHKQFVHKGRTERSHRKVAQKVMNDSKAGRLPYYFLFSRSCFQMRFFHSSQIAQQNHHSPLTTHHSPLTTHHSPLTSHLSPLTSHLSPLASHLSLTVHRGSSSSRRRSIQTRPLPVRRAHRRRAPGWPPSSRPLRATEESRPRRALTERLGARLRGAWAHRGHPIQKVLQT